MDKPQKQNQKNANVKKGSGGKNLAVRTNIKVGWDDPNPTGPVLDPTNHNLTLRRRANVKKGSGGKSLVVRTNIKAGGDSPPEKSNHNLTLRRRARG
jgi:hypothetical protein